MRQLEKEHTNTNILGMIPKTKEKEGRLLKLIQTEKVSEIDVLLKEKRVLKNAMIQVDSVKIALGEMDEHEIKKEQRNN